MTRQIQVDLPQGANLELLRKELRASAGEFVAGISRTPKAWYVVLNDDAPPDADERMAATLAAHDPTAKTPEQVTLETAATANARASAIPGWATWDEAETVAWIEDNVRDLESAKQVLVAMARLLVAQRDALWPTLAIEAERVTKK